tara:strand:- start:4890 stop:5561 length:672 start_codon:yes stop_codon:yes gene_type:complete
MDNIEELEEYLLENELQYNFERDDLIILGESIYESEYTNESDNEELSSFSDEESLYEDEWLSVYDDEYDNIDSEKIDKSYYLGLPGYSRKMNYFILLNTVLPRTFYKYELNDILMYLSDYSCSFVNNPKMHIMQLHINDQGVYTVVLKTHWLRIIQRKWKNIMKRRKEILKEMRSLKNLKYREIDGSLPNLKGSYPILSGMLSDLNLKYTSEISPKENTNEAF